MAAADQGQSRRQPGKSGETVEEIVVGPEHDAGPDDGGGGEGLAHRRLACRLGPPIKGFRVPVDADRRDVDEAPDAGIRGQARDPPGAIGMHRLEGLATALEQDADQVDHRVRTGHRRLHRGVVANVGGDRRDLADIAHRFQPVALFGAAAGDAHPRTRPGQGAHHLASDEPGAAEHGYDPECHDPSPGAARHAAKFRSLGSYRGGGTPSTTPGANLLTLISPVA